MTDTAHRRQRASRARFKLLTSILTTYGYAIIGSSLIQPLVTNGSLSWAQIFGIVAGLAGQALALYIAPRGEPI